MTQQLLLGGWECEETHQFQDLWADFYWMCFTGISLPHFHPCHCQSQPQLTVYKQQLLKVADENSIIRFYQQFQLKRRLRERSRNHETQCDENKGT